MCVIFCKLVTFTMDLIFFFFPPQQLVEEVSKEREEEKVKEIQEAEFLDEAAKRETKEVQTNELKAEKASLKAPKKTKTVQCKVALLDGSEYSCDLEVSQGAGWRAVLMCGMIAKVSSAFLCGLALRIEFCVPMN